MGTFFSINKMYMMNRGDGSGYYGIGYRYYASLQKSKNRFLLGAGFIFVVMIELSVNLIKGLICLKGIL